MLILISFTFGIWDFVFYFPELQQKQLVGKNFKVYISKHFAMQMVTRFIFKRLMTRYCILQIEKLIDEILSSSTLLVLLKKVVICRCSSK